MYAAAGGASIASRKARQHGRQPLPPSPQHSAAVRAYSCQHWEARLLVPPSLPPRPLSSLSEPPSPCDVDAIECAAGRAAWQEAAALSVGGGGAAGGAARRCSVVGDHPGARRDPKTKWHRNNRVRDASYGSSSDSDVDYSTGDRWGLARLLYAGLGTLAFGLVVYFVGTGDKGFKTPALRLVGPSLIIAGLACCLLRIALCIFAKPCCRRRTNKDRRVGLEGEEFPLARTGGPRTGPAQCSPARRLDSSSCDVSSLSSGEEDERLRRYRRAEPLNLPRRTTLSAPALQGTPTPVEQIIVQPTQQTVQVEPAPATQEAPAAQSTAATQMATVAQVATASQVATAVATVAQLATAVEVATAAPTAPTAQSTPATQVATTSQLAPAPSRRPPPRNVSFAAPSDGEIVLSVQQLRS